MSSAHHVGRHVLTLLHTGADYFPRLIAAIDSATESIYLETYIFADDTIGRRVAEAMQRAAQRGVRTHLMMDGFGSAGFSPARMEELRATGVQVLKFRPEISWLTLRRQRLRRLHRKLVVVDDRIAFIGGINITDDLPDNGLGQPRLDYAVEVQGEIVPRIQVSMRRLWTLVSWTNFRRQRERISWRPITGRQRRVAFLLRDNLRHRRDIEQAYVRAINAAKREILLANAYFLPGRDFRQALQQAAERGVKVTLLLQGQIEYRLQHYATLALYDDLLSAGIEIYQYRASFLHAKVAVVDGRWATVGSSNIEPFSLWLAREANLAVSDRGFAAALRASLLDEIEQGAKRVEPSAWKRRGLWVRIVSRVSLGMMRVLTSLIGFARGQDDV
ncbi:MAG: cardiolipin synthase ClsB [Gallionellaceae bacterium]|jgi:cardiolipin synthase|nr:cardiolipin synthase ClsB [Gallionellaceae bacterium]